MARADLVGLLVRHAGNARLLSAFLEKQGKQCALSLPECERNWASLQMLLLDASHAYLHQEVLARLKSAAVLVPVLLLLGPRDHAARGKIKAGLIDDVIRIPIAKQDLLSRMRMAQRLRERAQAANLKLERLVQDARWGAAVLAPDSLAIQATNAAFARMHGYAVEDLQGMPLPYLQVEEHDLGAQSHEAEPLECWHRRRDGVEFPVELEVTGYYDEQGLEYYAAFARDIQARKTIEAELQLRHREVQEARQLAEQASQAKSDFLANISHEIRTPLNGVLATLPMLLSTDLDERQRELAELIRQSSRGLLELVNEVLDFSKIEAGLMTMESASFSLPDLVRDLVETFMSQARAKDLELSWECSSDVPATVRSDPLRVRQILQNLLSNAIKFTSEGSVRVRLFRGPDGMVGLEVRDTGIGISRDQRATIFRPFTQADSSTTREFGGTGLGLSICERLAQLLGGRLELESAPGRGSVFRCWLPLEAGEADSPARPAPRSGGPLQGGSPQRRLRILICEDNPLNQRIMVLLLEQLGHEAVLASDGPSGLAAWEEGSFDLILMDLQMPGLSGLEVTREIRRREPPGRRIPIVALTARALEGDRDRCMQAGMQDYLTKPLCIDALARLLAAIEPNPQK